MDNSQAEKIQTRDRVLDIAARRVRETGFQSLIPADLAQATQLTPEAVHELFPSEAMLLAEAAERALLNGEWRIDQQIGIEKDPSVAEIVDAYLNLAHVGDSGNGCAICALAGETRYADANVQAIFTRHLRDNAALLAQAAGGDPAAHQWSLGAMSAIVGAVTLARAVNDPNLAKSILEETRRQIAAMRMGERRA